MSFSKPAYFSFIYSNVAYLGVHPTFFVMSVLIIFDSPKSHKTIGLFNYLSVKKLANLISEWTIYN